ncbi:probable histone-arginine methyltransferase CARM1 isoform X3 [Nymphaea colorata]|uniref:probable histone-arginine methyltransferase CARM1 isoform X3 n=1 Tax=Nymphaea colorata TaxID=210225 RepID=UPI00129E7884|nr:probable histone-arginine methyltransferase CARM1 isoform X3 [Nymphaea colorata]
MASVVDAERRFEFPNILISVHSPSSSASCPPPPPSSSSSSSPPSFSPSTASASSSSSSSPSGKSEVVARFSADGDAIRLRFHQGNDDVVVEFDLGSSQILALSPTESICIDNFHSNKLKRSYSRAVTMTFRTEEESQSFHQAFEQWKCAGGESGAGTYYAAVIENRVDFQDRIVVDVGAGSGILSLFAAQAGAKHVYAIEASDMVDYARQLISGNPLLEQRITVVKGKVEEVELPEKADILISEPMGTLLVNERMLESYVIARDRFLTSDGKMFPTLGRIHMAPFSDEYLYVEIANKALFWQQNNYYGVDLTPLYGSAFKGYFAQPVVDAFDPRLLVAPAVFHTLDFSRMKEEDLYEIDIPLHFVASVGTRVHGLACWFDVLFDGSSVQRWLTTAPGAPTTHWYQLRCVLSQPLYVMAGQEITGQLHLVAHNAQSYTMHLTMTTKMWGAGAEQGGVIQMSSGKMDLKEPYYRMSQPQPYAWVQDQQPHQLMQSQCEQETALLSQDVSSSGVISTQGSGP